MWDGKEWQNHCLAILRLHHGAHELHEVPDRHGGDLGLEAYSTNGCAYQCYAALEPLPTGTLYENQRDKLTEDLAKLKKNQREIARLFGSIKIRRYTFMVHRHDSHKLVQHGSSKVAEVIGWDLSFIADDFDIVVLTDGAFPRERASLLDLPAPLMQIDAEIPESVESWGLQNVGLLATVDKKLSAILKNSNSRQRYSDALVKAYLEGENYLSKMRDRYPDQWQAASRCRSDKENYLVLEYALTLEQPKSTHVDEIASDLAAELTSAVPAIGAQLAKKISWASVADWLMRCPLDFVNEDEAQ